jgi:hypothetical protein
LVRSNTIVVNSPGNYDYLILDANGKLLDKGKLVNGMNNIHAAISTGMYFVRFSGNDGQWTDRFIRQ